MKKFYGLMLFFLMSLSLMATTVNVSYSVNPTTFNETDPITITFTGIDESQFGVSSNHLLYLWAWSFDKATNTTQDAPSNGGNFNAATTAVLTYSGTPGTYTYTMSPSVAAFYARTGLAKIGFLVKNANGSTQSQDILLPVGAFQMTLTQPVAGSTNFVNANSVQNIMASTPTTANWQLQANGSVVTTVNNATTFNYNYTVTTDATMVLTATNTANSADVKSATFNYAVNTPVVSAAIPSYMQQGITYKPGDPTTVGLALYAPLKNFVNVIGSFNNWTVSSQYQMKRDTANPDLFWIEITGLTPKQVYTFQYRTSDGVKVADPYSPLVLSPDDDPGIPASTYPNMPVYPAGQQYDVSVIQTGMPSYNWQVTNFTKPAKGNLIVYEVLTRDFTANSLSTPGNFVPGTFQGVIDNLDYIKGLNVNAIELMPVMEFDGNSSWGYNPGFHYALDKAYGPPEKLKELIDKAHQKGIAVILDIALNHATGRSPLERMWSTSTTGGYGDVAANNPYFNQVAMSGYNVFYQFNKQSVPYQYYVNRVLKQWIQEYQIDGFRWDLTKGFTQNCPPSVGNQDQCTDGYQQDRVDVLKKFADYQWADDPNSIVIFEHLGTDAEQQQWANYRIDEGKGVILWDKLTTQYNQNTMGYADNSNFNQVNFENHGYTGRRDESYAESHDEERLMYKNEQFGNASGSYNVKTVATALKRQQALGAVLLAVPGPKQIWQFGELGYDISINQCYDGTVKTDGSCKLDPKPSALALGFQSDFSRKALYQAWAKILQIRLSNEVFNTRTFTVESGNLMPRIYIWNDNLPASSLKNVVILANFDVVAQNIVPDFPYAGQWYNLMNNSSFQVTNTSTPITLQPGEFRIFGNAQANLATDEVSTDSNAVFVQVIQNPIQSGRIQLRYRNAKGGVLNMFDLAGHLVKSVKTTQDSGDQEISAGSLSSGMYLIQLKSNKGTSVTKAIIP